MSPVLAADLSASTRTTSRSPGTVVELFAGVGGFRIGLERSLAGPAADGGWRWDAPASPDWDVVWGNQWEPSTKAQHAFDIYSRRFAGRGRHVNDDIFAVLDATGVPGFDGGDPAELGLLAEHPDALPAGFDLLVGGFPCQDYSIAKPLAHARGLDGDKGVLWWAIARILQQYRPEQVLLENVDRLLTSPKGQRGRDFAVILACFAMLGYRVEWRMVNAADYGMPTKRRRVFIHAVHDPDAELGFAGPDALTGGIFSDAFPASFDAGEVRELSFLGELDAHATSRDYDQGAWGHAGVMVAGAAYTAKATSTYDGSQVTLGDLLVPVEDVDDELWVPDEQLPRWEYLRGSKNEERTKTLEDGSEVTWHYTEGGMAFPDPLDRPARTILTSEGSRSPSRSTHVVSQGGRLRRLTAVEMERAMMFPDGWTDGVPHTKRAFAMGNALVVGVVAKLAPAMARLRAERSVPARAAA